MTEFVRFNALYEHHDAKTKKRIRYPAGWSGEVDAVIIAGARKAGALPTPEKTEASADLKAARKAVRDAEIALKGARDDAEKIEAQAALDAAHAELTALEA